MTKPSPQPSHETPILISVARTSTSSWAKRRRSSGYVRSLSTMKPESTGTEVVPVSTSWVWACPPSRSSRSKRVTWWVRRSR